MKRVFVCLLVVFSLMLPPLAHAAGLNCPGAGALEQSSKDKKQDDGKLAKAAHCCYAHLTAARVPADSSIYVPAKITSSVPECVSSIHASLNAPPLLDPPSHA